MNSFFHNSKAKIDKFKTILRSADIQNIHNKQFVDSRLLQTLTHICNIWNIAFLQIRKPISQINIPHIANIALSLNFLTISTINMRHIKYET